MIQLIVKVIASVLGGAYGIYATLTDFHEQKHGHRTLTKAGKRGIAFLIIVTAIGIGLDGWKEWDAAKNEEAGRASSKQTADKLEKVLTTAADSTTKLESVLREAQRAADPLLDYTWTMNFGFSTGSDQAALMPYFERVRRLEKKDRFDVHFNPSSQGFPQATIKNEASLAELANFTEVDFQLPDPSDPKSAYTFSGECNNNDVRVLYGNNPGILIECKSAIKGTPTKTYRSFRDFDSAKVQIDVNFEQNPRKSGQEFKDFNFDLEGMIELTFKQGRVCSFTEDTRVECDHSSEAFQPPNRVACFTAYLHCY